MSIFDFSRLEAYRLAIRYILIADQLSGRLRLDRRYLRDQMRRAALSIPLNITEGAGEFPPKEKARFYRIARRSATESAAILDCLEVLKLAPASKIAEARSQLHSIVALLTRMVLNAERRA